MDEDPEEVAEVLIDNYKDKEFTDPECNAATVVLTIDPDGNTVVNEIEPGDCELVKSDDDIKTNKEVIKKVIEDLNKKPPVISTPTPVPTPKPKVTLPKTTTPTQITTPRKKNIVKKTPIPNTNTATIQQKKDDISQRILLEKDDENEDETKKNENDAIYRSTGADMSIIAKNLSKKYIKTHNSAKTTTLVSTQLDARDIQAGLQIDDQNILLEVLNHAMIDTVTKEIDAMDGAKVSSIFADIAPELLRVELDTSVMTTQSLIADIDEKYLDEVDTYNNIIIPVEPISERDAVYRNQSSGNKSEDDQHQRYLDFL